MRRVRLDACWAVCALALALGTAPATALEPVKIAIVSSLASAPIFVAEAKGYFRDEGLAPELVRFDSAAPIAVAVAAGDIDFGSAGLNAAFFTLAHQGILKIIGSGNSERAEAKPRQRNLHLGQGRE